MSYLLCRRCNGYYELKQTESPHDFDTCSCGGPLRYIKSISKFYDTNHDYFEDNYDVDTTDLIYNSLKQFKNGQEISSNYINSDEELYQEVVENNTYFNPQHNQNNVTSEFKKEILSSEGFEYFKAVALEDSYDATMPEDPHITPVELQINIFETNNQANPYLEAPQEQYEFINETPINTAISQEYYDYTEEYPKGAISQEYYEDVEILSQQTFSLKKYFTNNALTLFGLGILPLEYLLLFGNLTLNIMGAFLIALSVIIAYLPRTHKIEKQKDVNRVFSIWLVYAVIFSLMLLSWAMMNLVNLPLIYV